MTRGVTTAHPRVGGENTYFEAMFATQAGSSPRGRGKLGDLPALRDELGLIPAWAGKTIKLSDSASSSAAHPRVGGENQSPNGTPQSASGSSPRGRGKRRRVPASCARQRLIPAWAGKTWPVSADLAPHSAHPRVGGENTDSVMAWFLTLGSSPRGRGKREQAAGPVVGVGLIPAWAGKTPIRHRRCLR